MPAAQLSTMRPTVNGISFCRGATARQPARSRTCCSVIRSPSQWRTTDSRTTRRDTGSRPIAPKPACSSAGSEKKRRTPGSPRSISRSHTGLRIEGMKGPSRSDVSDCRGARPRWPLHASRNGPRSSSCFLPFFPPGVDTAQWRRQFAHRRQRGCAIHQAFQRRDTGCRQGACRQRPEFIEMLLLAAWIFRRAVAVEHAAFADGTVGENKLHAGTELGRIDRFDGRIDDNLDFAPRALALPDRRSRPAGTRPGRAGCRAARRRRNRECCIAPPSCRQAPARRYSSPRIG